jgi:RimJ/RimL family protein N-acetyltransferase
VSAFRVRTAQREDVDGVVSLVEAVAEERQHILTEPPIDRERRAQQFRETVASADAHVFVAAADGKVVGELSAFRHTSAGPTTIGMAVAKAWRGQGVGSALMEACVEWAREARVHKLSLEVFPWNEPAIALYRKFGFVEEGRLRKHYRRQSGELWDVLVMGLVLES